MTLPPFFKKKIDTASRITNRSYAGSPVWGAKLLIMVLSAVHVDEVPVAVHALFFIAGFRVQHRSMGQHRPTAVGHVKQISMAFQALAVSNTLVGMFAAGCPIVAFAPCKNMHHYIFHAMQSFGVKEIEGFMGRRQMAVHTVGHETLGVVDMGRSLPGIKSGLDFMAGSAEMRRRCADHGVIGEAEKRKSDEDAHQDPEYRLDFFVHNLLLLRKDCFEQQSWAAGGN